MIKDIVGFEGLYQITDKGEVYSLITKRWLKPRKDKDGYLQVNLYKDGKQYTKKVHRLVCEAFIANQDGKGEVNHKDCQRDNNDVMNLEWVSHRENIIYQAELGHLFPNRKLKYHFKEWEGC